MTSLLKIINDNSVLEPLLWVIGVVWLALIIIVIKREKVRFDKINKKISQKNKWLYKELEFDINEFEIASKIHQFSPSGESGFEGTYKNHKFEMLERDNGMLLVKIYAPHHKFLGTEITTKKFREHSPTVLKYLYIASEVDRESILRALYTKAGRERWKGLRDYRRFKLEWNKFDDRFDVYSLSRANPFYDLDPDTMAKLFDLETKLDAFSVNTGQKSLLLMLKHDSQRDLYVKTTHFQKIDWEQKSKFLMEALDAAVLISNAFS